MRGFAPIGLATAMFLSLSLSGCTGESYYRQFDEYDRNAFDFYTDRLRHRADRIAALLDRCPGRAEARADAAAAKRAVNSAKANLRDAGGADNRDRFSAAEAEANWAPFFAAQLQAYNAAVACGLVAPDAVDPGGWSATWWDIATP